MARRKQNPSAPGTSKSRKRSGENEPVPAKRTKNSSFPYFPDGDVTIALYDISFNLHSKKLRESCSYFRNFDGIPKHFALGSSDQITPVEPQPVESLEPVEPQPVESIEPIDPQPIESIEPVDPQPIESIEPFDPRPVEPTILKRNRDANENIFRLLYDRDLACNSAQCLIDTSILVDRYGCVDVDNVRVKIALGIYRACTEKGLYRKEPWALLTLACNIREGPIFSEAFRHALGRDENTPKYLRVEVADLIASYTAKLRIKIEECWNRALHDCSSINGSIPDALAAAMMQAYLHEEVTYSPETLLTPNVYEDLLHVFKMRDVGPILEGEHDLLEKIDWVDESMRKARDLAVDVHDWDEEEGRLALTAAGNGLKMGVERGAIKNSLYKKLDQVQGALQPLFEDDKGVGYFTCMKFDEENDSFPW